MIGVRVLNVIFGGIIGYHIIQNLRDNRLILLTLFSVRNDIKDIKDIMENKEFNNIMGEQINLDTGETNPNFIYENDRIVSNYQL